MHLLTLPVPESLVFRRLVLLSKDRVTEVDSDVLSQEWRLYVTRNEVVDKARVKVSITLLKAVLLGDHHGPYLACEMPYMPKIESSGDWLLGLGTKLLNLASSLVTPEQVAAVLVPVYPGLLVMDRELVIPLPQQKLPEPLIRCLRMGFSFEVEPWKSGWFKIRVYWNAPGNLRGS